MSLLFSCKREMKNLSKKFLTFMADECIIYRNKKVLWRTVAMKAISANRIFNHTHVHGNGLHGTFHAHSGANFHI